MQALFSIGDFVEFVEHPAVSAPMPKLWFLLRLHPNYDLKAERQLQERGISAYVPKEKLKVRSVIGSHRLRDVPIFPGAMFIPDFDADIARLKQNADGIGGFVKYGGEALRVSLATMEQVRKFEVHRNRAFSDRKFKLGDEVRVKNGLFAMYEGKIDRLDRHYRIRVLITALQGEIPLELDEDQVEAV